MGPMSHIMVSSVTNPLSTLMALSRVKGRTGTRNDIVLSLYVCLIANNCARPVSKSSTNGITKGNRKMLITFGIYCVLIVAFGTIKESNQGLKKST